MTIPNIRYLYFYNQTASTFNYLVTSANTISYDNTEYNFERFKFKKAQFNQKRVIDGKGSYYSKQFDITIEDIASDRLAAIEDKKLVAIFYDTNGNTFITGFEQPYIFSKQESKVNDDSNLIEFSLVQNSYSPFRNINSSITGGTVVTPPSGSTPTYPAFYYGKISSGGAIAGANKPTIVEATILAGTLVNTNSSGTISITFNSSSDDYSWFAIPAISPNRTTWYVDSDNNGVVGGPIGMGGNLFPDSAPITVGGVSYKLYCSNWQTEIISMSFF